MSEITSLVCNISTALLTASLAWNISFAASCLKAMKAKTLRKTSKLAIIQAGFTAVTYMAMFATHWEASFLGKSKWGSAVLAIASWVMCQAAAAYITIIACDIYKRLLKNAEQESFIPTLMRGLILTVGFFPGALASIVRAALLLMNSSLLNEWQFLLRVITLVSQCVLNMLQCVFGILVYSVFIKMSHQNFTLYSSKTGWAGFHLIASSISAMAGMGIALMFHLLTTDGDLLMMSSVVSVSALLSAMSSSTYVSMGLFRATSELVLPSKSSSDTTTKQKLHFLQ
ncbi:hypothetical protein HDV06_006264 [Boothiomyces sp. JEL0866]|nr:hypothetical protein HDV06_006264 [Boothiomyces sp. JEL0866]